MFKKNAQHYRRQENMRSTRKEVCLRKKISDRGILRTLSTIYDGLKYLTASTRLLFLQNVPS